MSAVTYISLHCMSHIPSSVPDKLFLKDIYEHANGVLAVRPEITDASPFRSIKLKAGARTHFSSLLKKTGAAITRRLIDNFDDVCVNERNIRFCTYLDDSAVYVQGQCSDCHKPSPDVPGTIASPKDNYLQFANTFFVPQDYKMFVSSDYTCYAISMVSRETRANRHPEPAHTVGAGCVYLNPDTFDVIPEHTMRTKEVRPLPAAIRYRAYYLAEHDGQHWITFYDAGHKQVTLLSKFDDDYFSRLRKELVAHVMFKRHVHLDEDRKRALVACGHAASIDMDSVSYALNAFGFRLAAIVQHKRYLISETNWLLPIDYNSIANPLVAALTRMFLYFYAHSKLPSEIMSLDPHDVLFPLRSACIAVCYFGGWPMHAVPHCTGFQKLRGAMNFPVTDGTAIAVASGWSEV